MERFSHKGVCGIHGCIHIRAFKRRAGLARDKWFGLLVMSFKVMGYPLINFIGTKF